MYWWLAEIYSNLFLNVVPFLHRERSLVLWVKLANSLDVAKDFINLLEGFAWNMSEHDPSCLKEGM